MQSDLASMEKKRAAAAAQKTAATTKKAKAEVDMAEVQEQIKKHERMQVVP
jgi:hypothetical protein